MSYNVIHIFGQHTYHDDVHIIGSKESLIALRDAIDKVVGSGKNVEKIKAFVNDGEGFDLEVICCNEESDLSRLVSPYFDEESCDPSGLLFPWQIKIKGEN